MIKQALSTLKVITLALVLSFGLSYVYAWTAPASNPPLGNVSAPINTSATAQTKAGDLTLSNQLCLGGVCRASWPTGGGSYTDTDTLGTVVARGASTGSNIVVSGVTVGSLGAGSWNTILGASALTNNNNLQQSVAVGDHAIGGIGGGGGWVANTAVGYYALPYAGHYNTAVGANSQFSTTAGFNPPVGWSGGMYNTSIGNGSLQNNATGYSNTAIGYGADVFNAPLVNATAIGANAKVGASNAIQLGDGNVTAVKTSGTITAGADVCNSAGKCLSQIAPPPPPPPSLNFEIINGASGATYTRNYTGNVLIVYSANVYEAGLAGMGWYFYLNGSIVNGAYGIINYQGGLSPVWYQRYTAAGNFTVRIDQYGGSYRTTPQIIIYYL